MTASPQQLPAVAATTADDEIDLRQLLASLLRRWPWIAGGAVLGLLVSGVATLNAKKVWEGQFQIVLADRESGGAGGRLAQLAAANPMLANLAGLGGAGGAAQLETEVKILESPSVLKPIFDQVRARKAAAGENVSKLRFSDWTKDNLTVELVKGTSVLEISYRDTDQAFVLPVMQRISAAYQVYSGRDRRESLRNGLTHNQEQVQRFRDKAQASNRALDAFRLRYGISSSGGAISASGLDLSRLLSANPSSAQDTGIIVAPSGSSSLLKSQGDPLGQLAALNQELIRRRQIFTENDPLIQSLLRERDALRRYTESTAGGTLALPGQSAPSKDEAQSVLLRYQELERTAKRDTSTLDSLESALLSLQLEQARATKPWELISKPTLLDRPVSPRPARNLALGLLAGLVFGSGAALVADRRSGLVFSADEWQALLPYPALASLSARDSASWTQPLQLLLDGPLAGASTIALIPVGEQPQATQLQQALQTCLGSAGSVLLSSDLHQTACCDQQLLLLSPGRASRERIQELRQYLQLQSRPVAGLLVLA